MKMRMQAVFLVLVVALAAASCSKEPLESTPAPEAKSVPEVEQALLQMVNEYRTEMGQQPLSYSSVAYSYASEHTDYMVATGQLSHYNFSARASQIAAEADAKNVAENVAKDYPDAATVLQGWLGSESHRKTIEGSFTHTAISVKEAPDGKLYFTQLFYLK